MQTPSPDPTHLAFLRLYSEHEGALHTFVRSLLSSREEAAEVMQEVLVVLWQEFQGVREFRPWAFGVARNMALRHLRAGRRDRHVFNETLVQQLADETAAMSDRHAGHREALAQCLSKLPTSQRQLVLTAYTKGTRIDELARQRGQTPMALYKVLHRIRQALLDCVRRTVAAGEGELS